jgi:hypothetical protein
VTKGKSAAKAKGGAVIARVATDMATTIRNGSRKKISSQR